MTRTRLAADALMQRRRLAGRAVTIGLVVLNVCGVALYMWLVSQLWLRPEEVAAGITPQSAESVARVLLVLPLWTSFFVLDALWAFSLLVPPARWRSVGVVAAVVACWAVAVAIDSSHV